MCEIIEKLAYSLHLGNDKNKTKKARQIAKESKTGTTSFGNNAIQNSKQLSKVNNHNLRNYDNNQDLIKVIYGTNDLVEDVKKLYLKEFEKAKLEYNKKQTRSDRKIDDYFTHISNNSKNDLACEIIIELGDMNFWKNKSDEYKLKMIEVYKEQVNDFTKVVPSFKIANATLHFDESSPHMHVIGVPIKDGNKNGMKKQVGKAAIFTKDSLKVIQDEMREYCINSFNRIYQTNYELKDKEKGRNKDINVKDMGNYSELKKEAELNKLRLEQANMKTKKVDDKSIKISKIIEDLKPTKLSKNNYVISKENIDEITDYVKEVKETSSSIKGVNDLTVLMEKVENDLKDHNNEVKNLKSKVTKRDNAIDSLKNEINDLENTVDKQKTVINNLNNKISFLETQVKFLKDKFKKFLNFLQDKLWSPKKEDKIYENVIDELHQDKVLDNNDVDYIQDDYRKSNEKDDLER